MKKLILICLSTILISATLTFTALKVFATNNHKVTICHQVNTISIDEHALDGHFYNNGHTKPGHSGDHLGACVQPSPSPSVSPSASPSLSPSPSPSVSPSPSPSVSPEPSPSPSPSISPSPTPTPSYSPDPTLPPEKSDGLSSDPGATQAKVVPYSELHPEHGKPSQASK